MCDDIAELTGAVGTLLIPLAVEDRGHTMPHSRSLDEALYRFVETGWHKRDFRAQGFPKAISNGFVTDHDLIDPGQMDRHPYYAGLLAPVGLKWFVGTSLKVHGNVWGVAIHGKPTDGPFQMDAIERLLSITRPLASAVTRAAALGDQRSRSLQEVLSSATKGVVVIDWAGRIASQNERAEEIFASHGLSARGRLKSPDPLVDAELARMIDRVVSFCPAGDNALPRPVSVGGPDGSRCLIDAFPMPRDFQSLVSGACAIVTLTPVKAGVANELRERFQMTQREVELANYLAKGESVLEAAAAMGITISTARHYLKSIYAKTSVNRQGELVALLSRVLS